MWKNQTAKLKKKMHFSSYWLILKCKKHLVIRIYLPSLKHLLGSFWLNILFLAIGKKTAKVLIAIIFIIVKPELTFILCDFYRFKTDILQIRGQINHTLIPSLNIFFSLHLKTMLIVIYSNILCCAFGY